MFQMKSNLMFWEHRGLVVKASDFHAAGRGFDSRSGRTVIPLGKV